MITPLGPCEERVVVRLAPEADTNLVIVRRDEHGYVAVIDTRWSDEDPRRSHTEWKRAADLYDLYVDIAWSVQVWDSADAELEAFFPAPRALI